MDKFEGAYMRQKKFLFLTIQQFVFLAYFILTTAIFFIAVNQGNEGVTLRLFGGGDDGFFYWTQARNIAVGQPAVLTSIYPLIIGYLIKITGIESVYVIRIFNYIGFILLIIFSLHLIEMFFKLEDEKIALKYIYNAKILILISFLFYASLQMNVNLSIYRDVWIYTLYVLSIILSIKLIFYKKNKFFHFILWLPSLWLLGEFRGYALVSFVLSIILYFSYKRFGKLKRPILTFIILVALFGIYYTLFMNYRLPYINMSLRDALNYRDATLTTYSGGSQMWIKLDHPFFGRFFINYIHSYIGNLLGPLPWHIRGISTLFVFFVETIPMFLILRFLWKKRTIITKMQGYVLIHAFVWISLIAVLNDNIGTATRLRPVAWILILIVFASLYSKNRFNKKLDISQMKNIKNQI